MSTENSDSNADSVIVSIVNEFTDRMNAGEKPDVEEYVQRLPEHAATIRDVLETVTAVRSSPDQTSAGQGVGDMLGEYEIKRELGRGGMAVVYEAKHHSLTRRVALKVMKPSGVDGFQVERFQLEARAAARLHHTNIVPVFEAGSADGKHFIAMQLIDGLSLDRAMRESAESGTSWMSVETRPTAMATTATTTETAPVSQTDGSLGARHFLHAPGHFSDVANVGLQIANAVAYSHSHDVLHRDIKPSNILLDDTGTAWLADFGLASTGDEALTQTGDVVGTLRYMGPERFSGRSDVRSDIYSIGATLYETIAGQPAFESHDRLQLIRSISNKSPARLSALNPSVPRDLETIVHKAMASEPDDRYQSAAAMATDLDLFLRGEAITSRRQSLIERGVRWRKRNPLLASVSAGLVLAVLIGAALFTWQYQKTRTANLGLAESNANLIQARDEAELVADFLTQTFRSPVPGADGRQLKVIELFENAKTELEDSKHLAASTRGAMYLALSEGLRGVGLWAESVAMAEEAVSLLPQESDKRLEAQAWLGASYANNDSFVKAITLLEDIVPAAERQFGSTHDTSLVARKGLAAAYRGHHRFDRAIELFEKLVAELTAEFGSGDERTIDATNQLGTSYVKAKRAGDAIAPLVEALRNAKALTHRRDYMVSLVQSTLAFAYTENGQPEIAIPLLEDCLTLRKRIYGNMHPELLELMNQLGGAYHRMGDIAGAADFFSDAFEVSKFVNGKGHRDTVQLRLNLGGMYLEAGRARDAIPIFEATSEWGTECEDFGPNHPQTRDWKRTLAAAYEMDDRWSDAEAIYRGIIGWHRDQHSPNHGQLAGNLMFRGRCLVNMNRAAEAEPILRNAIELWATLGRKTSVEWYLGSMHSWLGESLVQQGKNDDEAEKSLLAGEKLLRAEQHGIPGPFQSELPDAVERLVRFYETSGDEDAVAMWRQRLPN